ncbi:hypothetical protein GUITHDRAFT_108858 [Guillardia theta CCMP2712]|uniref:Uncharacterized protein n=1 Tax=Guillardia theta (strain CCMP2712) TaxID=905079 RepID=L1JA71_GUITC|nr:hypothetical protein GUITHDRAFT_108858 [Guillardia theta CCMP2712]EKX45217.1 hypothetical protein GUITHDRAFT_108858 [Guillardia theta CCMP2712]|eukprot:XP_005832197.1 hypothetical protein GUITHDRAFT_108858 [Guillardia theta CCMP2712]
MVTISDYGSLPEAGGRFVSRSRRAATVRFIVSASAILGTLAVVTIMGQRNNQGPVILGSSDAAKYLESGRPLDSNADPAALKNIWYSPDQAWQDIDTVLPTNGGAWEDQSDPSVGYAFKGRGSVTASNGWTGYYDTTLHDGEDTEILPDETVNDAMGWDPALAGTNVFWGNRGGKNAADPAAWHNGEPLSIADFSDSDYVPYGFVLQSYEKVV